MKLAFLGFGQVAREFARLLQARRELLQRDYDFQWRVTGIATARHGCVVSPSGIDLNDALQRLQNHEDLSAIPSTSSVTLSVNDALQMIHDCDADLIFETTPLSPLDGEPAASYLRQSFERGIHVVTANKGPLACSYRELQALAKSRGVKFRFEGTVMDGAPVFNMKEVCLPATRVLGFAGVLNSTTNLILTGMEAGRSFEDCLKEARHLGIVEANADYDIDGWDAAVKAVALANVLMSADLHPRDLQPEGIRNVTHGILQAAQQRGKTLRLIARAETTSSGIRLRVALEEVLRTSPFANLHGTSNALLLFTDLMGEIGIVEGNPGITQTAYALLSDLLRIHEELQER